MNKLNENYFNRLKSKGFDVAMDRYERDQVLDISASLCVRMNEAAAWLGIQQQNCGCGACVETLALSLWPKYKEYEGEPNVIVEPEPEPEPDMSQPVVKPKRKSRSRK